jgi:hypothetical protein
VPLGLLAHLGLEELLYRPDALGRERGAHRAAELSAPGQQPRLEERRHNADVADAFLGALRQCAHTVADLESDVPQERHQPLDRGTALRVGLGGREQQHVDVRAGMELAAAVAAHRDQRPLRAGGRAMHPPCGAQHRVDERGARVHQLLHRLLGEKARLELLVRLAQQRAPGGRVAAATGQPCRKAREQRPGRCGGYGCERLLQEDVSVGFAHREAQLSV